MNIYCFSMLSAPRCAIYSSAKVRWMDPEFLALFVSLLMDSQVRQVFLPFSLFPCFLWSYTKLSFPVAQMVEHGASNAKIMGSIPRESKSWSNVKKKKLELECNVSRFG